MTALRASHLHRFFHAGDEEVQALRDVSLEIEEGELIAITGPSGSGKSTLVACLCGLDEPDGGTVWVGAHFGARIGHFLGGHRWAYLVVGVVILALIAAAITRMVRAEEPAPADE